MMMVLAATASLLLDGATEPSHEKKKKEKKKKRDTDGGGESFNQIWPPSLSRHHSWMTSCGLLGFFFSFSFHLYSSFAHVEIEQRREKEDEEGDETTAEFKVRALLLSWTTLPANNDAYRVDRFQVPRAQSDRNADSSEFIAFELSLHGPRVSLSTSHLV